MNHPYGRSFRNKNKFFGSSKRQNYSRGTSKKTEKKWGRLFLLTIFLAFLGWSFFSWEDAPLVEGASVNIIKGNGNLVLEGTQDPVPLFSGTKIFTNDIISTKAHAKIALEFQDGSTIFLNQQTRLKIKEHKDAHISMNLDLGQIWASVFEDPKNQRSKDAFLLDLEKAQIKTKGGIFDIKVSASETVIRLIKGKMTVKVENELQTKSKILDLGVGQKLVLNQKTRKEIFSGKNVVLGNDNFFLEDDWHLKNLENFDPEAATQIRRKIEIKNKKALQQQKLLEESQSFKAPVILSPEENFKVPANSDSVIISGTTDGQTYQITVNGYTLTQYQPGDQKWRYYASKKFGTLVPGENTYEVQAVNRSGEKSKTSQIKNFL